MKFDNILFGFIMLTGLILFGVMHEQAHSEIYLSYGIKSNIEYFSHFPDFVTIAESPCPTDSCELANNINDIIGYSLMPFYILIGFGFFLVLSKREEKNE